MKKYYFNCFVFSIFLSFIGCNSDDYRKMCRDNDYEAAHKVLDGLYQDYADANRGLEHNYKDYNTTDREQTTEARKYKEALDYIFNAEALYLFSCNDNQSNSKITYLLTQIPVKGVKPQNGAEYNKLHSEVGTEPFASYEVYRSWVADYNTKCTQLLDLAITNNQQDMAKKILTMYKEDINVKSDNDNWRTDGNYVYENTSKEAGQEKYNQAFKDQEDVE